MKFKCIQVGVGWRDKILKLLGKKKFKKGIFIIKKQNNMENDYKTYFDIEYEQRRTY